MDTAVADDEVIEMLAPGDAVITRDIPLAARVVKKQPRQRNLWVNSLSGIAPRL